MHINMKYYVVTMGGIFISLGVGMLIGFNLNYDQELSKQQTAIIEDLDVKFEKLKDTNNELKLSLKNLNEDYDNAIEFINLNVDNLINEKLNDRKIGILSTSIDENSFEYIKNAIDGSNGSISFNINFTNKVTDNTIFKELSENKNLEITNLEELVLYVKDSLKGNKAKEDLQLLEDLGLIEIKSLESNYIDFDSIILTGDGHDDIFTDFNKLLIQELKFEDKYIIGTETSSANSSYIQSYSDAGISTVDNINEGTGKLTLVLALKDKIQLKDFSSNKDLDVDKK